MHNLGVVLDFQKKTIKIDKILLPMRNITNLNSNLALPGHLGRILALPRSHSAPAVPPSKWYKSWTLSMRKQIFQP
jgi:hypothetical protein